MKKNLYVLIGCPASGKSTWIKNHLHTFNGYTVVESRDELRFMLVKPDEEYFSREKEVFNMLISNIKGDLSTAGVENVVADATHLNEASRGKLLRALGNSLKDVNLIAVYFDANLDKCLDRNENRVGTRAYVPQSAIRRMFYQKTKPTFDEGFNKIIIYKPDAEGIKYTILEDNK